MTVPEQVMASIPKVSHKMDEWTLYVTNYRVVVGKFTSWGTFAFGFVGMAIDSDRAKKQAQVDPNEILMKDKKAFEIGYHDLDRVECKGGMTPAFIFHFIDGSKPKKFKMATKKEYLPALSAMAHILGPKAMVLKGPPAPPYHGFQPLMTSAQKGQAKAVARQQSTVAQRYEHSQQPATPPAQRTTTYLKIKCPNCEELFKVRKGDNIVCCPHCGTTGEL